MLKCISYMIFFSILKIKYNYQFYHYYTWVMKKSRVKNIFHILKITHIPFFFNVYTLEMFIQKVFDTRE